MPDLPPAPTGRLDGGSIHVQLVPGERDALNGASRLCVEMPPVVVSPIQHQPSPRLLNPAQTVPHLRYERAFWQDGISGVAGVDEVGRGALAGPLVAAAVIFPCCDGAAQRRLRRALAGVRDSKQISPDQRQALLEPIMAAADAFAVGIVDVDELDAVGLGAANRLAMERAVLGLVAPVDALVLDACVLDLGLPQVGLIDGDAHCLSIAAASIVAKVTRDRIMIALDGEDDRYAFAAHKGYGSALHQRRLREHGPGPHHRRCFGPVARLLDASP